MARKGNRTLAVKVDADVKGEKSIQNLARDFANLDKVATGAAERIGHRVTDFAIGALRSGADEVVEFIATSIEAASQLEQAAGAVESVFGEAQGAINDFAESAADAFGLSQRQVKEFGALLGAQLQGFGFEADAAAKKAVELQQRAADMAATFGGTVPEAVQAISSLMRGERDPIEKYGVTLKQADIDARALALGLDTSTVEAKKHSDAIAALDLLYEQTATSQGQFARESDTLAGQQARLAANLENAQAELGEKFMPILVDLVEFLNKDGIPALSEFIDLLDFDNPDSANGIPVLQEIEDFLNATQDAGVIFGDMLRGMENDIRAAATETGLGYMEMRRQVKEVMDRLGVDHQEAIDYIFGQNKRLLSPENPLTNLGQYVAENMGGTQVRAAADEMAGGIVDAMEAAEEEGKVVARRTPGSLANELRAGIDDYDEALEELTKVAENSVSDLAERQKIEGILASQELTDALNSDSTRTRLLAQEFVNDLISDYELLAPGAMAAGELVNPELADGINSNVQLAIDAAENVVDAAGNPLVELSESAYTWGKNLVTTYADGMRAGRGVLVDAARETGSAVRREIAIESEPESPASPLRGITDWGANLVRTYADGILHELGTAGQAARSLAGAVVPQMALPSLAGAGAAPMAGGGGGGVTINLTVNGDLTSDREAGVVGSVMRAWEVAMGESG